MPNTPQQTQDAIAKRAGWPHTFAFVSYLENTLIPDLRESGREATADDFDVAKAMIKATWPDHYDMEVNGQ